MSAVSLVVGLLLGIFIGAALGYLYARGRMPSAAADLNDQLGDRFAALSAQALDASTARFLQVAEGRLQAANGGPRPGAAGASCSCAGWSSWPG
jgi:DNA recombination protein RmuC